MTKPEKDSSPFLYLRVHVFYKTMLVDPNEIPFPVRLIRKTQFKLV